MEEFTWKEKGNIYKEFKKGMNGDGLEEEASQADSFSNNLWFLIGLKEKLNGQQAQERD